MTHVAKLPTLLPTDRDAVYVVTGGNRGLGLEHVRQFLEKTDAQVVATTTNSPPSEAKNLRLLADQGNGHRMTVVSLDLSKESSIKVYCSVPNAILSYTCCQRFCVAGSCG